MPCNANPDILVLEDLQLHFKSQDANISSQMRGLESRLEQTLQQVTDTIVKDIAERDERVKTALAELRRDMTVQHSGDLSTQEERLSQRIEAGRREQKAALSELRAELGDHREHHTQLASLRRDLGTTQAALSRLAQSRGCASVDLPSSPSDGHAGKATSGHSGSTDELHCVDFRREIADLKDTLQSQVTASADALEKLRSEVVSQAEFRRLVEQFNRSNVGFAHNIQDVVKVVELLGFGGARLNGRGAAAGATIHERGASCGDGGSPDLIRAELTSLRLTVREQGARLDGTSQNIIALGRDLEELQEACLQRIVEVGRAMQADMAKAVAGDVAKYATSPTTRAASEEAGSCDSSSDRAMSHTVVNDAALEVDPESNAVARGSPGSSRLAQAEQEWDELDVSRHAMEPVQEESDAADTLQEAEAAGIVADGGTDAGNVISDELRARLDVLVQQVKDTLLDNPVASPDERYAGVKVINVAPVSVGSSITSVAPPDSGMHSVGSSMGSFVARGGSAACSAAAPNLQAPMVPTKAPMLHGQRVDSLSLPPPAQTDALCHSSPFPASKPLAASQAGSCVLKSVRISQVQRRPGSPLRRESKSPLRGVVAPRTQRDHSPTRISGFHSRLTSSMSLLRDTSPRRSTQLPALHVASTTGYTTTSPLISPVSSTAGSFFQQETWRTAPQNLFYRY